MEDTTSTHLIKSSQKQINDLEKNNTPFPRACNIKDFSFVLVGLDRQCSNIEELVEIQVTILNQVYENKL